MSVATVLLSSPPDSTGDELRQMVASAGFVVADHLLGSTPAVDFASIMAALVEVGSRADLAAAQTKRWRAELGDQFVPMLWLASPTQATAGLEAGADAVLPWPVDPALLHAQLRTMVRAHAATQRIAARAGESRLLGDQLRRSVLQLEREHELARHLRANNQRKAMPPVGAARFHICHRARSRSGGDFHSVQRLDEEHVGILVGDVIGTAAPGALLGIYVQQAITLKDITTECYRLIPPGEALTTANRQLLRLGMEELPLVALFVGALNVFSGAITIARAGLPPPLYLPASGPPAVWSVPGPFLSTAVTTYGEFRTTLMPGDRLLVGTDGLLPDGNPRPESDALLAAATKHRDLTGPTFVEAVAHELLQQAHHADDFTLMGIEMLVT